MGFSILESAWSLSSRVGATLLAQDPADVSTRNGLVGAAAFTFFLINAGRPRIQVAVKNAISTVTAKLGSGIHAAGVAFNYYRYSSAREQAIRSIEPLFRHQSLSSLRQDIMNALIESGQHAPLAAEALKTLYENSLIAPDFLNEITVEALGQSGRHVKEVQSAMFNLYRANQGLLTRANINALILQGSHVSELAQTLHYYRVRNPDVVTQHFFDRLIRTAPNTTWISQGLGCFDGVSHLAVRPDILDALIASGADVGWLGGAIRLLNAFNPSLLSQENINRLLQKGGISMYYVGCVLSLLNRVNDRFGNQQHFNRLVDMSERDLIRLSRDIQNLPPNSTHLANDENFEDLIRLRGGF